MLGTWSIHRTPYTRRRGPQPPCCVGETVGVHIVILPVSVVGQGIGGGTSSPNCSRVGPVRDVLRGEERRFAGLLTRGRKVLTQLGPGRPLTEANLRYLYQTHGLPPELVTELLD